MALAKKLKTNELLLDAAAEVEQRTLAVGACKGPDNSVDAWGALCLAAGAKYPDLQDNVDSIYDFVPPANIGQLLSAYRITSAATGKDIAEWSDISGKKKVAWLFRQLAHQIETVFVPLDQHA